ncbi:uncharacterized protein LOC143619495 [Bidens hawaiensis]|uniref:uncharacterized protein LOC143619495 n=1 Tax=Bidens hawaiensis TaxID=980011 RepID=UPI00404B4C1F
MTQKHLHELLKEDQEPFHLKTFIADRRSQLKPVGKSPLAVRKPKPIINASSSTTVRNFCINHVCLFSSNDSPAFKKSLFLDFPASESKTGTTTSFVNIPVQKPKPGSKSKQIGFGLFGSLLQRLKDRSIRAKRREIEPGKAPASWSALEASCSLRSVYEFEETEGFGSNPSSPFRFSLQRSPSPTRRKSDSPSPAESPGQHFQQEKDSFEVACPEEIIRQNDDEKEQFSPVSVLDPLFDDDEEEHDGGATEEDGYDIENSYANVERAKHQLLQKLKRFERLAGIDPIQLENWMLEQCYDEDKDVSANGEEMTNEECVREIMNHLGVGKIPWYMKKLVFDLIEEEKKSEEHDSIVQRVCNRLHLWKVVDLYTIDMIVETDFKSEGWKRCDEETIRDTGMDIEMAIFEFLVEELAQELVF